MSRLTPEDIARAERIASAYVAYCRQLPPKVGFARWFHPERDLPHSKEVIQGALVAMGTTRPAEQDVWMFYYAELADFLPPEEYRMAVEGRSAEESRKMRDLISKRYEARMKDFKSRVEALRLENV